MMDAQERQRLLSLVEQAVAERTYLWRLKDVLGTSVGFRVQGGRPTDEPVVTVYVRKGRKDVDPAALPRHQRIPATLRLQIGGKTITVGTDIVESELGELCQGEGDLVSGLSIGTAEHPHSVGTVGWIARVDDDKQEPVLTTAFHVLVRFGHTPLDGVLDKRYRLHFPDFEDVMVPAVEDGGRSNIDNVGYLLAARRNSVVDVAAVRVSQPERVRDQVRGRGHLGPPRDIGPGDLDPQQPPAVAMSVRKDHVREGHLIRCQAAHAFGYPDRPQGLLMTDLLETTIVSQPGDSGALLVDDQNRPLGMLLGRAGDHSFFIRLHNVAEALNLKPF